MWIDLNDGWRDESSEGPYCETLETKYDWAAEVTWTIYRGHGELKFQLRRAGAWVDEFDSVEAAKQFITDYVPN